MTICPRCNRMMTDQGDHSFCSICKIRFTRADGFAYGRMWSKTILWGLFWLMLFTAIFPPTLFPAIAAFLVFQHLSVRKTVDEANACILDR